jgi:transposase InsO family protein
MGRNVSRRNDANEAAWAPKMRFSGVWAHCQPARLWDRPRFAASDFCGDWIASFRDRHTLYVAREFGFPKYVRVDNGTELTSNIMQAWSEEHDVEHLFIQPGKPTQNAYIESFNSRLYGVSTRTGFDRYSRHELQ